MWAASGWDPRRSASWRWPRNTASSSTTPPSVSAPRLGVHWFWAPRALGADGRGAGTRPSAVLHGLKRGVRADLVSGRPERELLRSLGCACVSMRLFKPPGNNPKRLRITGQGRTRLYIGGKPLICSAELMVRGRGRQHAHHNCPLPARARARPVRIMDDGHALVKDWRLLHARMHTRAPSCRRWACPCRRRSCQSLRRSSGRPSASTRAWWRSSRRWAQRADRKSGRHAKAGRQRGASRGRASSV